MRGLMADAKGISDHLGFFVPPVEFGAAPVMQVMHHREFHCEVS